MINESHHKLMWRRDYCKQGDDEIFAYFTIIKIIKMQQTLNFLSVLDLRLKKSNKSKLQSLSMKDKTQIKKPSYRYPYAKALNISEEKYSQFPKWLIEKEGFIDFMYKNYESKMMSIPKICEKENRASDEKYFVSLYLQQVPIFRGLPNVVKDILLNNLKTKYYSADDIIHHDEETAQFIGIIFLGEVEYKIGKRKIIKQKNDVILIQAMHNRTHPEITCKQQSIILTLNRSIYPQIQAKLKQYIQQHERHLVQQFFKSTFFTELHFRNQKAKKFYNDLQLDFYFCHETIEQAGTSPLHFYMIYQGEVRQENSIYVKEYNKWPLSNDRWEVRAVYNSYNKKDILKDYKFFCDEEILDNLKLKSKFVANTWVILFTMKKDAFVQHLNSEDLKRIKKYRAQHVETDFNQLEDDLRQKIKSNTERKKIVLKAINTTFAHKTELSPRKQKLIRSFEQSMLGESHRP